VSGWANVRLDECCEIVAGSTPKTSVAAYWGGDICWATPKDLSELEGAYISDTPRKLTRAGLDSCAAEVLPAGSVLFSSRAPIGHVAINTVPMATNQGFKSFVPKPNKVHAKFLYHWLRKNRTFLESLGNGATFKEVSKSVVSRIQIGVPPLEEQRRIAAVLDRAQELRIKRRATLAQLDTLTQSIFLDLFGDPVTNPRGWQTGALERVVHKITDGTHKTPTYVESGIEFLSAKDLKNGGIAWGTEKFISRKEHLDLVKRCNPERGDVLLAKSGSLGSTAIIDRDHEFSLFESLCLIKHDREKLDGAFLAHLLRSPSMQSHLLGKNKGIAIKHLHLVDIRQLVVPLPPLPLQKKFSQRVTLVEDLKRTNVASLAEMDALFASLQYRAFRGEL
jgi:type I restriction enzyme, S subunit